jgi:hypothetical protein
MKALSLVFVLIITSNIFAFEKCKDRYVPETTYEELLEIRKWASVLAFIPFAEKAGFSFDSDRYFIDYPNPNTRAFNFGFVTGYECYPVDVVSNYYSYNVILTKFYYLDLIEFKKFYIKNSEKLGYMDYLSPLPGQVSENFKSKQTVEVLLASD